MNVVMEEGWKSVLKDEFEKEYFVRLRDFVYSEYRTQTIYPPARLIFNAFDTCPFDKVKVVILGQDPYHEPEQAHGLSFSVLPPCPPPPSLNNIYKEIRDDIGVLNCSNGDLTPWAEQGVLLLNATLTVRAHAALSHHNKGWEIFTSKAVEELAARRNHIVFMLWGSNARAKKSLIDPLRHLILEAPHPSPLSAYRGFFGCRHFSKANQYLIANGMKPIVW